MLKHNSCIHCIGTDRLNECCEIWKQNFSQQDSIPPNLPAYLAKLFWHVIINNISKINKHWNIRNISFSFHIYQLRTWFSASTCEIRKFDIGFSEENCRSIEPFVFGDRFLPEGLTKSRRKVPIRQRIRWRTHRVFLHRCIRARQPPLVCMQRWPIESSPTTHLWNLSQRKWNRNITRPLVSTIIFRIAFEWKHNIYDNNDQRYRIYPHLLKPKFSELEGTCALRPAIA